VLNDPVLWSRNILDETKELICQALDQSSVLHGAETRTQECHKLLAAEKDVWTRRAKK
jgi:hypothetical protein